MQEDINQATSTENAMDTRGNLFCVLEATSPAELKQSGTAAGGCIGSLEASLSGSTATDELQFHEVRNSSISPAVDQPRAIIRGHAGTDGGQPGPGVVINF